MILITQQQVDGLLTEIGGITKTVERHVLETPTGPVREALTEANILILRSKLVLAEMKGILARGYR